MSKLDYNGNQSIGLMGRDLLTPEEVKQLHYKTIIFPTIGYPIFRSTVLYKEFSCYKSGELLREPKLLKDLSDIYFIVDKLNTRVKKQKVKPDEANNDSVEDFYSDLKKEYEEIDIKIEEMLTNKKYEINYPIENSVMYCSFNYIGLLCKNDENKINDINNGKYHIEIIFNVDKTMTINIHKKSMF